MFVNCIDTAVLCVSLYIQRKGNKMTNTIEELEQLLANAYELRKKAYKLRAPKFVTSDLNNQINSLRFQIVELQNA